MKLRVSDTDILMFEKNKNALLLSKQTCRIFAIVDFTIEDGEEVIVKKKWFSKKSESTTVKQKYLTKLDIQSWHSTGKFVGILTDEASAEFAYKDIYQMRRNWLEFKEMLKGFGMDVQKIEETPVNLDQSARDHLKEFFSGCGYETEKDIINYAVSFAKSQKNKS